MSEALAAEASGLVESRDGLKIGLNRQREAFNANAAELESLRRRKTQIPEANLKIRELLARDLELSESELPFAGELLKVKDEEQNWEGAIERVLHNFGLSVLVGEQQYKRVSAYVDRTNLKGRIVYYKVPGKGKYPEPKEVAAASLLNKIEIKADAHFYDWLISELLDNFNYECCDAIEQFQREPKALTRSGQIKGGRARHEKDDRKSIFDRKSYVLGWSNQEKIKAIEKEMNALAETIAGAEREIKTIEEKQKKLKEREASLRDFTRFTNFGEIHWQKEALEIER